MNGIRHDLRCSLRQLTKGPVTTAAAVVSLVLGIGANTAIFSLINALVLRPLPIPHPEQLVRLVLVDAQKPESERDLSIAMLQALQARQNVLSGLFAWNGYGIDNIEANGARYVASTARVSNGYFSTLGIRPHLGRFLGPEDVRLDEGRSSQVAVIDYRCWKHRYGGDPAVLGKTIRVEGLLLTIVGVAPESFLGLGIDVAAEVTLPIGASGRTSFRDRKQLGFAVYGRLKPDITIEQARSQLESIWPGIVVEAAPEDLKAGPQREQFLARRLALRSAAAGSSFLREQYQRSLFLAMAMVGALLLIACVNLANLMLARTQARRHEFEIRRVLGATRWRLIRQILFESLLLSLASALPALSLARYAGSWLLGTMWTGLVPLGLEAGIDLRVFVFAVLAAVMAAVLFGALPARSAAVAPRSGRTVHAGASAGRSLIPLQVALSMVLLIGSLLFVHSLRNLRDLDGGFRREGLLLMQSFPQAGSDSQTMPGRVAYYRELADRLSSLPGVAEVSYSHMGPVARYEAKYPVSVAGAQSAPHSAVFELAGPRFFHAAGVPVLSGREFGWMDTENSSKVAILSESLARRLFPDGVAVGRRIDFQEQKGLEVVGVVKSASLWKLDSREPMAVYLAFLQMPAYNSSFVVLRTSVDAKAVAADAGRILESMGRQFSLRVEPVSDRVDRMLATHRMVATVATFLGAMALLLSAVGLYGLVAHAVGQRTAEIGVRIAVGAQPRDVAWLVLRDVAAMVGFGVSTGIPATIALAHVVREFVFGVSVGDSIVIAPAAAAVLITALLAGYVPARRATQTDPATALRV